MVALGPFMIIKAVGTLCLAGCLGPEMMPAFVRLGGAARRRSGGGRDGGWGLRVAAVAGCGTADRFAG